LLSNDAHSANHFRLAQAGVMNINECKHLSASPRASQAIADSHFVHSLFFMNGFCSKIYSSKRLLVHFEDGRQLGGWGSMAPQGFMISVFFVNCLAVTFAYLLSSKLCVVCICLRIGNQLEQIGLMLPELFNITV